MPLCRSSARRLQRAGGPHASRVVLAGLLALVGWTALSLTETVSTAASTYYVAPNGLPSNDGSLGRPLDLDTALSSQGPVRPGDTVWLRGGVYRRAAVPDSRGNPVLYVSTLNGTAAAPILVRQYPNERVTLDGNLAPGVTVLVVDGTYTSYWGFEITNSSLDRAAARGAGLNSYGHHNKFINLIIHDTGQGVGFWATTEANDSELYGSLISHVGTEGADRGHGHSVYAQNVNGTKRIVDNILFEGFSFGIHAYTEGGRIDNLVMQGNIVFNHGNLSRTGGPKANLLLAGSQVAQNPNVTENFGYYPAGSSGRNMDVDECNNGTFERNYFAGGTANGGTPFRITSCSNTVVRHNTLYGPVTGAFIAGYPNNTFGTTPTGTVVNVRPNVYEPGRANVVVYNWDRLPTVSVDLSRGSKGEPLLVAGDRFEVRDAQNYFGPPVLSGVYSGPVQLPMTGLTAAPVIGNAPIQPGHTSAEFGAFVVQRQSTAVPLPTVTFTATPTTIAPGASTTLSWTTSGATSVSIDQGIGTVGVAGSRLVAPAATTTYTVTATNSAGWTVVAAAVTVRLPESADGSLLPPAAELVDAQGAVWRLSGTTILRNGATVAGGSGSKLLWLGGSIYAFGTDGNWWRWSGASWSNVGRTQPGGGTTPPPAPPSPTTSADGTIVPPAGQIVDAQGAVWTISGGRIILRNGASAAGGSGTKVLWTGGAIYVLGTDDNWWRWTGSGWSNVGRTQPGGGTSPTPPSTPPPPTTSSEGTLVPPAANVIDSLGAVWTISGTAILRNGASAAGGSGSKILWTGGSVYVLGTDLNWWRWVGSTWSNVGRTQPGTTVTPPPTPPPAPPPTPPPPGPSASGVMVPPASQVVDGQNAVWTISGTRILRNGNPTGATGTKILLLRGTIYVVGTDNWHWWQWTGSGWIYFGTVQPV